MKQLLLSLLAILLMCGSAKSKELISGNSNTFLKNYQVTQISDNQFELSYSNSHEKFSIEVCSNDDECYYLLRNPKIEVMYLCNNIGFGLRKMPTNYSQLPTSAYCKRVNCKTFMYQALITTKERDTKEALGLIACFFPDVVNLEARELVFQPINKVEDNVLTATVK